MPVLTESKICSFLTRVLDLSAEIVPLVPAKGTEEVSSELLDRYSTLINDLSKERENDSFLDGETWNWIWEGRSSYNHIRLYGRLAWINLQLLELL